MVSPFYYIYIGGLYMIVEKRNGTLVPFDKEKIVSAIEKAFIDVDGIIYETDTANDIATEIEEVAENREKPLTVEEIQDLVEQYLMKSERGDVARSYIRYRYK